MRKTTAKRSTADSTLQARLDQLESKFSKLLDTLTTTQTPTPAPAPAPKRLTMKEQRARRLAEAQVAEPAATTQDEPGARSLRLLEQVAKPRRQRKQRHMPARSHYRAAPMSALDKVNALQSLSPATVTIYLFIEHHPDCTGAELGASLDFSPKTVANALWQLRKKGMLAS